MARLKRDHSGWSSSGLYLKYQQPTTNEEPIKKSSKKNTTKWCRGKSGVEHQLQRYFWRYGWESKRTNWIRTRCVDCRKEFHRKDSNIPLRIDIDEDNCYVSYPVQVKVNGKAIPFNFCQLESLRLESWHWCKRCKKMH